MPVALAVATNVRRRVRTVSPTRALPSRQTPNRHDITSLDVSEAQRYQVRHHAPIPPAATPQSRFTRRRCERHAHHRVCACSLAARSGAGPRAFVASDLPAPKNWTAAEDHRQMMEQLGITALRPGPSGNEQDPNHANYDEAKANPFPKLPDVAHAGERPQSRRPRNNGRDAAPRSSRTSSAKYSVASRRTCRRSTWTVTATDTGTIGGRPVVGDASSPATSTTRRIRRSPSTSR